MSYEFIVQIILLFLIFDIFLFIPINFVRGKFKYIVSLNGEFSELNQEPLIKFINLSNYLIIEKLLVLK
jgi:hypothetical protein